MTTPLQGLLASAAATPPPYLEAIAKNRRRLGRITQSTAKTLRRSITAWYNQIDRQLVGLTGSRAVMAKASREIVRTASLSLTHHIQTALIKNRALTYDEVLSVYEEASLAAARLQGISARTLGGIALPRVAMAGAYDGVGAAHTFRTLLASATGQAAKETHAIIRTALLKGKSPMEVSRRLRSYVVGGDSFAKTFGDVVDLRTIPRGSWGAAQQMTYNADRIAFTELHNARAEAETEAFIKDPLVAAIQWMLSPNRGSQKQPDECDILARANYYDLGPGVYPVRRVPTPPHPFDRCERIPVTRPASQAKKPKANPDPARLPTPGASGGVKVTEPKGEWLKGSEHRMWGGQQGLADMLRLFPGGGSNLHRAIERANRSMSLGAQALSKAKPARKAVKAATEALAPVLTAQTALEARADLEAAKLSKRHLDAIVDRMGTTADTLEQSLRDDVRRLRVQFLKQEGERIGINDAVGLADDLAREWTGNSSNAGARVWKVASEGRGAHTTYNDGYFIDHDKKKHELFVRYARQSFDRTFSRYGTTFEQAMELSEVDHEFGRAVLRRAMGNRKIKVYRGDSVASIEGGGGGNLQAGATGHVRPNSLSSWSVSQGKASSFNKVTMEIEVGADDVWMAFVNHDVGFRSEMEVVVLGHRSYAYKIVHIRH